MNNMNDEKLILGCMEDIYINGPCNSETLAKLALCKFLNADLFSKYESEILLSMGLFYKNLNFEINSRNFPFAFYRELIKEEFNELLTPIQADIENTIKENKQVLFSAPTSIGKSHILREIVLKEQGNVIVIVPTRALLNEYVKIFKTDLNNLGIRNVNVLPFIENVNLFHATKNIFVLTPERCFDLFKTTPTINLFVFDEAQLGDSSQQLRSLKFRSVIKKINHYYPDSKKIYTYPFAENIEDIKQLDNSYNNAIFKKYNQLSVGQLFIYKTQSNQFHILKNGTESLVSNIEDPIKRILGNGGRILIFCDKAQIYKGTIYSKLNEYISMCSLNVNETNQEDAFKIIKKIEEKIGSSSTVTSELVENLKKGVAIHHGSLPHEIRVLIELFINSGYSQICFATPTLEQGINLPFDLIYIDSFRNIKTALDLKNLIGRAGRTKNDAQFEYGIVVFRNKEKFFSYFEQNIELDFSSDPSVSEDDEEFKEAIINDEIDNETNLPKKALERMSKVELLNCYKNLLYLLLDSNGNVIKNLEKDIERTVVDNFFRIYKEYLNGREVFEGEEKIFYQSIYLMIDRLQRKKFSQIVNERYSYARKNNWKGLTKFEKLPCKSARFSDLLNDIKDEKYYFDTIVYDTFEYLDKNYNLVLKDIFYGVAYTYQTSRGYDKRNESFMNLLKYGSDDLTEVFLFKYGFDDEEIEIVKTCIACIDENEIIFNENVFSLEDELKSKCLYYKYK